MIKLFCDAVTPGPEALDFVNKTVFIIAIIAFVVTIISFAIVAIRRRKTKKFYGDGNKNNEKREENDSDERLR